MCCYKLIRCVDGITSNAWVVISSRYAAVVEACGLLPDIESLIAGDQTEVGAVKVTSWPDHTDLEHWCSSAVDRALA